DEDGAAVRARLHLHTAALRQAGVRRQLLLVHGDVLPPCASLPALAVQAEPAAGLPHLNADDLHGRPGAHTDDAVLPLVGDRTPLPGQGGPPCRSLALGTLLPGLPLHAVRTGHRRPQADRSGGKAAQPGLRPRPGGDGPRTPAAHAEPPGRPQRERGPGDPGAAAGDVRAGQPRGGGEGGPLPRHADGVAAVAGGERGPGAVDGAGDGAVLGVPVQLPGSAPEQRLVEPSHMRAPAVPLRGFSRRALSVSWSCRNAGVSSAASSAALSCRPWIGRISSTMFGCSGKWASAFSTVTFMASAWRRRASSRPEKSAPTWSMPFGW